MYLLSRRFWNQCDKVSTFLPPSAIQILCFSFFNSQQAALLPVITLEASFPKVSIA
jgi:hypothetical protein